MDCKFNIKGEIRIILLFIWKKKLFSRLKVMIFTSEAEYYSNYNPDFGMAISQLTLDEYDLNILRTLQEDARLTTKELAAKVNLSTTPVFERLKKLEKAGYIKKYVAILDAEKLNLGFEVFCSVKLKQMSRDVANNFVNVIKDIPQVRECYNVSGEFDYILKINAPNMKVYNEFVINVLGTVDSIGSIQSTFVMNEIKHSYSLNL